MPEAPKDVETEIDMDTAARLQETELQTIFAENPTLGKATNLRMPRSMFKQLVILINAFSEEFGIPPIELGGTDSAVSRDDLIPLILRINVLDKLVEALDAQGVDTVGGPYNFDVDSLVSARGIEELRVSLETLIDDVPAMAAITSPAPTEM